MRYSFDSKKPVDAMRKKVVDAKSSTSYSTRPDGLKEKRLNSSVNVRYL